MFIIDPEKITLDQLKDYNFYIALHDLVLSYNLAAEIQGAQDLYNKLLSLLQKVDFSFSPELLRKYKKLSVLLQFVSLPNQKDEVISGLFKENLLTAIYHGIDVQAKIELHMLVFSTNAMAEQLSRIILKALSENGERIGKKFLAIKGELKPLEPVIKNWLKDYINSSANYKVRDDLSLGLYINQSKNIKQLSKKEIEVLIPIIKIYNFLTFPSANMKVAIITGHAAPSTIVGEKITQSIESYQDKPEISIQRKEKSIKEGELKQLASQYPPGSLERKAVEEELRKMEGGGGKGRTR